MMGFDMNYLLMVMLPGMALSGLASMMVKNTFAKYENVISQSNMTGAEAAQLMLQRQGVTDCKIEPVSGRLSDHYDPRVKTLRLSEPVYGSRSLSAIGVACHEAGHALQHAQGYSWLKMRSTLVPVTNISSKMSMPVIMIGGVLMALAPVLGTWVLLLGCALFAAAVLFSVVTLPVEWDASARAKKAMVDAGIVNQQEIGGAGSVLNAAFLTYLAAAIASIMTLLYYLHRTGVLRMLLSRR
ncbi:MAG: zinc metallopeptidase [Gammaproteobacteria bacterium]|nr:zinc metallopeptidase [Gammaproteobacteria bacterium]